jgi:hypothetical protein
MGDRFWTKLWQGTAPLALWAAHFFFCYLYAAADGPAPRVVLGGVTLAALAGAGWLARQACRAPGSRRSGLRGVARLGGAILAFVAIAWGALPLLVLPS